MISKELVIMNAYLPAELAKLSRVDEKAALEILRAWGDGKKPLRVLWSEAQVKIKEHIPGYEFEK